MDEMKARNARGVTNRAQVLADIARELNRLSRALAACAEENSPAAESLRASQSALANLVHELEEEALGRETTGSAERETARLRQAVLENLHRRGPVLFPELAAATLSLPDEIRPVLQAMAREGLVEIQTLRGWEMVSLTARGRNAVRHTEDAM
jgi:hypothetical protein